MAELRKIFLEAEEFKKKGLFDKAIELYNQILDADPEFENVHSILGEIYYIKGDVDNAVKNYELEIGKTNNCLTLYRLGIAYYRDTQFNKAINILKSLMDKGCQLDMAYYWMGLAYYHTGRIMRGIEMFEKLREKMPQNTVGCYNLALSYQTIGQHDKAVECLQRILEEDQSIVSVHYHLAEAYLEELKIKLAIEHFQKVVELDPKHKLAQKKLDDIFNDQDMLHSYGVKLSKDGGGEEELNINYYIGEAYKGFNKIDKTFKYLKNLALEREKEGK